MTSPRAKHRGLGAELVESESSEVRRYINKFSTPGRLVLDELFGSFPATERVIFPALLTVPFLGFSLSQTAHCTVFAEHWKEGLAGLFFIRAPCGKVALFWRSRGPARRPSFHLQELDDEVQRCLRWDIGAFACFAVAELGGDEQFTLAADSHGGDAFVAALEHVRVAERK
jgi:hypothetical protein